MINIARLWNNIYRQYLPILVLLYLGLLEYGFSYLFCMEQLYHKLDHKSIAIGLITLFNFCLGCLLCSWGMIHFIGNGVIGVKIKPFDLKEDYENGKRFMKSSEEEKENLQVIQLHNNSNGLHSTENTLKSSTLINEKEEPTQQLPPSSENQNQNQTDESTFQQFSSISTPLDYNFFVKAPDFFMCDKNGLPTWCNECNSIKVLRSRHSKHPSTYIHKPGQCIAKMDHYCTYIGHMIGGSNYIYFLFFVTSFTLVFIVTLIPIFCYFSQIGGVSGGGGPYHGNIHPVLIIIIIVNLFFVLITVNLIGTCWACVLRNDTLLDKLNLNRMMKLERKVKAIKNKQNAKLLNNGKISLFNCFGSFKRDDHVTGTGGGPALEGLQIDIEYCRKYVSLKHPVYPGIRMILPVNMKKDHPFDNGIWNNFKESFNSLDFDNVDELMKYECELISVRYREKLIERVGAGEGWVFGSTSVIPVDVNY